MTYIYGVHSKYSVVSLSQKYDNSKVFKSYPVYCSAAFQERYSKEELRRAISYCMERELFTAADFGDTLEYFKVKQESSATFKSALPLKYSLVIAQQRPLGAYASLMKAGGAV